jgi:homoserine kinase type II
MAVLTQVSEAQASALSKEYGLGDLDALTGIPQGIENTNYKLMAGGRRYILTLFEGRTDLSALPYFLALMGEVAEAGLPAPRPIKRPDGAVLTEVAGKLAALVTFLSGRDIAAPTPANAQTAGVFLAKLHLATRNSSLHRPNSMGPASWRSMAERLAGELARFGEHTERDIGRVLGFFSEGFSPSLPMGPIHGDFFPDNLLLDHGEVSGIIDFYFACTDYFAYDLAVAMNAYTPEGRADKGQDLALLKGYRSIRPLTSEEEDALPVFLAGSALRFFLSRATDLVLPPQGALYNAKDPTPWLHLMRRRLAACGERR